MALRLYWPGRGHQCAVRARLERRQGDPGFRQSPRLGMVLWKASDQLVENCRMAGTKVGALCRQPVVKLRAAVQVQPLGEIPHKKVGDPAQLICSCRVKTGSHGVLDLNRIDLGIAQIKADHVFVGHDPATIGPVQDCSQLAEIPAQLASWVACDVAKELADAATTDRMGGKRQVDEQRPQLARLWQSHRATVMRYLHPTDDPDCEPSTDDGD